MTKTRRGLIITFTILLVLISLFFNIKNTSSQPSSSTIIVENNNIEYTSTLPSFPQQLMNLSEAVMPRAFSEYSTKFFKEDLSSSNQLLSLTESVNPRLRVEYISGMVYDQLTNPPSAIEELTSLTKPRIIAEYSTITFMSDLDQPTFLPIITICDQSGQLKSVFQPSEDVYVLGINLPPDTGITIYVIPNTLEVSSENAVTTCWGSTNSNGEFPITLVWTNPLTEGEFDIWADLNQNGTYDEDVDEYINSALDVNAFTVIPELPSWLILTVFTIAILMVIICKKHLT